MSKNCTTCRHWRQNPQLKLPKEPQPTPHKFLWWTWEEQPDPVEWFGYSFRCGRVAENNRTGYCHRFPEQTKTEQTYLCGEYEGA